MSETKSEQEIKNLLDKLDPISFDSETFRKFKTEIEEKFLTLDEERREILLPLASSWMMRVERKANRLKKEDKKPFLLTVTGPEIAGKSYWIIENFSLTKVRRENFSPGVRNIRDDAHFIYTDAENVFLIAGLFSKCKKEDRRQKYNQAFYEQCIASAQGLSAFIGHYALQKGAPLIREVPLAQVGGLQDIEHAKKLGVFRTAVIIGAAQEVMQAFRAQRAKSEKFFPNQGNEPEEAKNIGVLKDIIPQQNEVHFYWSTYWPSRYAYPLGAHSAVVTEEKIDVIGKETLEGHLKSLGGTGSIEKDVQSVALGKPVQCDKKLGHCYPEISLNPQSLLSRATEARLNGLRLVC